MKEEVFESKSNYGVIRFMLIDGKTWFVGRDVAIALGYKDPGSAIRKHIDVEDTFKTNIPDACGFCQSTTIINESGLKNIISNSKNKTKNWKNKFLSFIFKEFGINVYLNNMVKRDRKEMVFKEILKCQLDVFGFDLVCQKQCIGYRIDFYIPKIKLAIEYDEGHHLNKANIISDSIRQAEIEKKLGCTFIRLDHNDSHAKNAAIVLKQIFLTNKL